MALQNMIGSQIGKRKQYLYSLLAVVVVSVGCFLFSDWMGYRVAALVLLLVVSILAVLFDILPVLLSAALSAFIWNFFFIPPRFTFHIGTTEDTILLIMYFVIAIVSGILTFKIRAVEKAARLKDERANSVKLYNTILDSLAHELRTPIAAIIVASDNLQINNRLSAANRDQLVQEILTASLRLNQQVENLLNISRLESGHIQPKRDWCDVQELVYDTVKRVEENHPARKVGIHISDDVPLCRLDKVMFEQVIYNLLNNAAIHTPTAARIDIALMCHADLLEVIVEDNGPGFGAIEASDVFHKFSRDRIRKGEGSGLGLSIVKGFTEALGGTVELQNKRGSGARFIICLPVKTSRIKI